MSSIQNIRTQGASGSNTGSSDSTDNFASTETRDQNSADFAGLEGLRNKITIQSATANNAGTEVTECTQQAQQYKSEAKNSTSISAVKELIQMAKEMIERAMEQTKIMREAFGEAKNAKSELEQKSKNVPGIQGSSVEGNNQYSFLFNQKPDNAINI